MQLPLLVWEEPIKNPELLKGLADQWISLPSIFKPLPGLFTSYWTLDALDYPPNQYDGPCAGPFPNGLGGVYVVFTQWCDLVEGQKNWAWQREYLYVGKALDCRQRLLAHFRRPSCSPFDRWLGYGEVWNNLEDKWLWCAVAPCSQEQRAPLEMAMIKVLNPTFNRVKA